MIKFNLDEKLLLKLIALVLAITTWFYVNGELNKSFGPRRNVSSPIQENGNKNLEKK